MYVTSDHYTVAIDAADCHVLWSYQWIPRDTDYVHPHRGAALANGKIIRGTGDDYLISLDAESGKLLWAKQIADPKAGFFISMPALVTGDMIYIGPAGSERAGSGWIGAFKLSNGAAGLEIQHYSEGWRAGRRHLGAKSGSAQTRGRRALDSAVVRQREGNPVRCRRQSGSRFLGRRAARRQPVHEFHDRPGRENGPSALVQPVHSPRRGRLRHHARQSDLQSELAAR